MSVPLAESYAVCRQIVREARSNFALAFRLLTPPQRQGMHALYAFMRLTDDISDAIHADSDSVGVADSGAAGVANATAVDRLRDWQDALNAALAGQPSHPIHPALVDTIQRFDVNPTYLHDVIRGVAMDLEPIYFETFEPLRCYCYRVASAVGLACLPIWGCTHPDAQPPGEAAGIAFQLTNILRDLGEDQARQRVYLPRDELARFGCEPSDWLRNPLAYAELMAFQVRRVRAFYDASEALHAYLPPSGRAIFMMMSRTYRGLLNEIERRRYDVFRSRVRLPRWRKAALFAAAWPIKWGWWPRIAAVRSNLSR